MARIVRGGLIQATLCEPVTSGVEKVKQAMIDKHVALLGRCRRQRGRSRLHARAVLRPLLLRGARPKWYELTERMPDGPTTKLMQELAKKHKMVIVVPMYEEDLAGVYYNTAAVIDNTGEYLGKFRKMHIPQCNPGFWEKFYFRPGNLGYPVFDTKIGKVGVYICYDRHFPEGARCLGLNGAEIVFNPSATVAGLSEYLWKIEQPAHAVANQYFVGAINRPGMEEPWKIGEFYGQSYFCDPRGQFVAQADRAGDAIVVADMDLDQIREVRNVWQFFRDRRPDSYDAIVAD